MERKTVNVGKRKLRKGGNVDERQLGGENPGNYTGGGEYGGLRGRYRAGRVR